MKNELLKLILSIILFLISFLFKDKEIIYITFIFLSYIIISLELFINLIKKREFFDENTLMIIASLSAFIIGDYMEGLMIMILFQIGEVLSEKLVDNSKKKVMELTELKIDYINLLKDGIVQRENVEKAIVGDIFIVKPGEKVPLDGTVIKGESLLNLSVLTGESIPKKIKENEKILSGSLNLSSVLIIKAESDFHSSTSAQIIKLLEETKKSKTEKFITKFSKIYTKIIVLSAFLITFIPCLLGANFDEYLYKSLIFLVTACPCAIIISVPLTYYCAIGKASKEGVLIKNSSALDCVKNITIWALDKTGTLTKGNFKITKIESENNEFLKYLKYVEYYSSHPLTRAIDKKDVDISKISNFEEVSGYGVKATVFGKKVLAGNYEFLNDKSIPKNPFATIYMSIDGEYQGYVSIGDEVKEEAFKLNKNIIILSGDSFENVKKIAHKLHIKTFCSNLTPLEKVDKINELKLNNKVAFVGDGVNDAPSIKCADVGISMGNVGSDISVETADIIFMNDDISKINNLFKLSKDVYKIVCINIFFSLFVKFLILFLALIGKTALWGAVFADVGVTFICILNSLRILKR